MLVLWRLVRDDCTQKLDHELRKSIESLRDSGGRVHLDEDVQMGVDVDRNVSQGAERRVQNGQQALEFSVFGCQICGIYLVHDIRTEEIGGFV